MDKAVRRSLQQFAQIFQDGRQRNVNEADTVMYLTKFFTDVLGYDLFSEITKEFQVRDRYCDIAIKVKGEVRFLVETKAMPLSLSDKHIEQAENYASRAGIQWVVLTSGISWRLYHLTFDSGGIEHDLAFEVNLTPECDLEEAWKCLSLLSRDRLVEGDLEIFWQQKKSLSPTSLLKALFTEEVLNRLRRELHRKSDARLELEDVGNSLRRLLNPEVLTEDIKIRKARKKRKKVLQADGQEVNLEEGEELEQQPVMIQQVTSPPLEPKPTGQSPHLS
jgi:predicted type IV restriction endonuclease